MNFETVRTYFRLLAYLKNMWFIFLLGIFFSSFSGFLDGWLGQYIRPLIDSGLAGSNTAQLIYLPVYIFCYFLLRAMMGFASVFFIYQSGNKIMTTLRFDAFSRLMGSRLSYVKDSNTGGFLSLLNYDVSQVEDVTTSSLRRLVLDLSLILTALYSLVSISYSLTLLILGMAPLMYLSLNIFSRKIRKESERIQDALGRVMRYAEQSVHAISTIRSMSAHAEVLARFKQHLHSTLGHQMRFTLASSLMHASLQFIMSIPLSISFALIIWHYIELSTGDFAAFFYTVLRIMPPIRAMSLVISDFQRGIAAAKSVFKVCDLPQVIHEGEKPFELAPLVIEELDYKVGPRFIFKNINLTMNPYQLHVLVGLSGVGKSSLLLIIAQLIEERQGIIRFGDNAYDEIDLADFRNNVGFVDQTPFVWDDSILNNILFPGTSDDYDVDLYNEVLKITALEDWVSTLPEGSHTFIGTGFLVPSGGQKQRIGLARALYQRQKVIILDEPTASIDEYTGRSILACLNKLKETRLIIIASHQKMIAESADCVHYMTPQAIRSGSHEQLMLTKSYRSYWQLAQDEQPYVADA